MPGAVPRTSSQALSAAITPYAIKLAAGGWRPERVVALDLFPQTPHVETVCLLRRDGTEETES